MENRIWSLELLPGIDLRIIWIYFYPWCTGGEACIGAVIPLHWSSGIVTAFFAKRSKHLLRSHQLLYFYHFVVAVNAVQITEFRKILKGHICHGQFLSLVNIRGTLHHVKAGGKHFCGNFTVFSVISPAGNHSRLIMITPKQTVPRFAFKSNLPFGHDFL